MLNKLNFKFAATLAIATTLLVANPSFSETLQVDVTDSNNVTAAITDDLSVSAPTEITITALNVTGGSELVTFSGLNITSNNPNSATYTLHDDVYNAYYSLTHPTTTEDDTLDSVASFSNSVFYNREYQWDRTKELSLSGNLLQYTDVTNNKTATGNNTLLGDTIALLNQNTTGKTVSTTNASDTYTATANFGTSQGVFTLTGAKSGDNLSKVDFNNNYTGFVADASGKQVNINNIEFVNAKTTDGSVLNVSNGAAKANLNNVKIAQTGDLVLNQGLLTLDGKNNIQANIKGNGTTTVNSGETNAKSISQGILNTVDGAKLTSSNISVGNLNNAGNIEISASNLKATGTIDNTGKIIFTEGTTQSDITGMGEVQINTNSSVILQNSLEGTLNLQKGNLKLNSGSDISSVTTLRATNNAALDLQDSAYTTTDLSVLESGSTLNVLIDASLASGNVDKFSSTNALSGNVYIKDIKIADYLTGEIPIELTVALDDNIKAVMDIADDFTVTDSAVVGNLTAVYDNGKVTLKSSTLADAVKSQINKITYAMTANENVAVSLGSLNGSELAISGSGKTIQGATGINGISVGSGKTLKITDTTLSGFNDYAVSNGGSLELQGTNTINSKIAGDGTTNVNTGKTTIGASFAQQLLKIFKNAEVEANANNLAVSNHITNDGTLTLTAGNNSNIITRTNASQDSIIDIKGTVTNEANITQNEVKVTSGSLTNKTGATIAGGVVGNNAVLTNEGSITSKVNNYSTFENKYVAVDVDNYAGTFTNRATVTGTVENKASGARIDNNGGSITTVKNILGGIVNNIAGTMVSVSNHGTLTNNATINSITNTEGATFTNNADVTDYFSNQSALASNSGTIAGNVLNIGTIANTGIISAAVTNGGTISNTGNGEISGTITNTGDGIISSSADKLTSATAIANDATLQISGGTTKQNITGSGTVEVSTTSGYTINKTIENKLDLISGTTKLDTGANVTGQVIANGGTLSLKDSASAINTTTISDLLLNDNLYLAIDTDITAQTSDIINATLNAGSTDGKKVLISNINVINYATGSIPEGITVAGAGIKDKVDIASTGFSVTSTGNLGGLIVSYDSETGKISMKSSTLQDALQSEIGTVYYSMAEDEDLGALSAGVGMNGKILVVSAANTEKVTGTATGVKLTDSEQKFTLNDAKMQNFTTAVNNEIGADVTLNNVEITTASNGTAVNNEGKLTLSGNSTINNKIIGNNGSTVIDKGTASGTKTTILAKLTQKFLTVNKGAQLEMNADNIDISSDSVKNNGTLALTGGTIKKDIVSDDPSGEAKVKISANAANEATVTQKELEVEAGKKLTNTTGTLDVTTINNSGTIVNNSTIQNGTINNEDGGVITNTAQITSDIVNKSGATLTNTGDGTVKNVTNNEGATFTTQADKISGNVTNDGDLTLTGNSTLTKAIANATAGKGTTTITGNLEVSSTGSITQNVISVTNAGATLTNKGTLVAQAINVSANSTLILDGTSSSTTATNFNVSSNATLSMLNGATISSPNPINFDNGNITLNAIDNDVTLNGSNFTGSYGVNAHSENDHSVTIGSVLNGVTGITADDNSSLIFTDVASGSTNVDVVMGSGSDINLKNTSGDAMEVNSNITGSNYDVAINNTDAAQQVNINATISGANKIDVKTGAIGLNDNSNVTSPINLASGAKLNADSTSEMSLISNITGTDATSEVQINPNGTTGLVNLATTIKDAPVDVVGGELVLTKNAVLDNSPVNVQTGAILNAMTGDLRDVENVHFEDNAQVKTDVDIFNVKSTTFSNYTHDGDIVLADVNPTGAHRVVHDYAKVYLPDVLGLDNLVIDPALLDKRYYALSPIRRLVGRVTDDNFLTFSRTGDRYADFNPAVMASPVAAQVGGYLNQLNSYDQAFMNMDMYMLKTKAQRQAMKMKNQYAMSNSDKLTYDNSIDKYNNSEIWFRPYANYEEVSLKGGPSVDNFSYGSYFGDDSQITSLSHGWDGMYSVYIGYNGSHQNYDHTSIYQNGGTLGIAGMLFKGDFFTGLTLNSGASSASASTMYGSEDMTLLMGGIASKTGYNLELFKGKFIIQPSYLMSYSFVNTLSYRNAADVKIHPDLLSAIQMEPGIKLIGNLENGLQPYIGISVVCNIMDKTNFRANEVMLPDLSVKPFVKYVLGVRKPLNDRISGFLQAQATTGGRTGIGLQAGLNIALGKTLEEMKKQKTKQKTILENKQN